MKTYKHRDYEIERDASVPAGCYGAWVGYGQFNTVYAETLKEAKAKIDAKYTNH